MVMVADMVVQARDLTLEAKRLAERDPSLKGENAIMASLSTGIAEVLKYKQPKIAAMFIAERLQFVSDASDTKDVKEAHALIKDLKVMGGKNGFESFDWALPMPGSNSPWAAALHDPSAYTGYSWPRSGSFSGGSTGGSGPASAFSSHISLSGHYGPVRNKRSGPHPRSWPWTQRRQLRLDVHLWKDV